MDKRSPFYVGPGLRRVAAWFGKDEVYRPQYCPGGMNRPCEATAIDGGTICQHLHSAACIASDGRAIVGCSYGLEDDEGGGDWFAPQPTSPLEVQPHTPAN